jgi:glutaredoxin
MKLDLYKMETCPFCRRVLNYLQESGRSDVTLHDIRENEEDLKYLVQNGGKNQVPCLFIDGQAMYESLDIIEWLKANP